MFIESGEDSREPMEQEDDNHGNGDNGNEETSPNEGEESSERESGQEEKMEGEGEGEGEAGSSSKEGETGKQDDEGAVERMKDLFTLSAVNAYGSQEVRKIEDDPNKMYTITSESLCIYHTAKHFRWTKISPNSTIILLHFRNISRNTNSFHPCDKDCHRLYVIINTDIKLMR